MSLVSEVIAVLATQGIRSAVIGAAALALHGASRATEDVDLLAVDSRCLDDRLWDALRRGGTRCDIRRGDDDDPLAGVVRCERTGERTVDLVVGRAAWQRQVIERASALRLVPHEPELPVVGPADLVLLKLYAGGPQDAWDIRQLLLGPAGAMIRQEVGERLDDLPLEGRSLWEELTAS